MKPERDGAGRPATPEDAATVALVREGPDGLEVYMTRRQDALRFLGGYYVFPGGKVDAADRSDELFGLCPGFSLEAARARLAGTLDPRRAAGFFLAATRELFEEAGVLLDWGGDLGARAGLDPRLAGRLARLREELSRGETSFAAGLRAAGLRLDPGRLLWLSHWITPATSPRRFSTFFFLAALPPGQEPTPLPAEISEACWARPDQALAQWRSGRWAMIPPTIATLDVISRHRTWAELAAEYAKPPGEMTRMVWG